jgi:hypothetical protein
MLLRCVGFVQEIEQRLKYDGRRHFGNRLLGSCSFQLLTTFLTKHLIA